MIGIFDSGVGGLSIYRGIKNVLPEEDIIYLADEGNFPYGSKSETELLKIAEKNSKFLMDKGSKMIVVACNTATCHTISSLREKIDLPFVGVVPVVKTAASVTSNGKIGILATSGTINSKYQKDLVRSFCSMVTTYSADGSSLIEMIENDIESIPDNIIKEVLDPLIKENVDTVALGCTHYHFLLSRFQKMFPEVNFLGSEGAVSRQVNRILKGNKEESVGSGKDMFYTTGKKEKMDKFLKNILNIKGIIHEI